MDLASHAKRDVGQVQQGRRPMRRLGVAACLLARADGFVEADQPGGSGWPCGQARLTPPPLVAFQVP
jgi:hypothetical protein